MIVEHGPLDQIAARMNVFARLNPWRVGKNILSYRRQLPRGLEITLLLDEQGWYLEIARFGVMPSAQEEAIIRREFNVPEDAVRGSRSAAVLGSNSPRFMVRWRWEATVQQTEEDLP